MENGRLIGGIEEGRRADVRSAQPLHEKGGCVVSGSYAAFGVAWSLHSDDASAFHRLLDHMPPGFSAAGGKAVSRAYVLCTEAATGDLPASLVLLSDGKTLARSFELSGIAEVFEQDLKWHVAGQSPRRVFLRAGVVGWRDRAIVLPGGPSSGKSTLVRALARCGATCFSDEYAVMEGANVHPYPGRLPLWTEPGILPTYWSTECGELGMPKPLPVGIVVFAPYRSGAVFKPKLLSRGKSMLALFEHAVAAQRSPDQVLRVIEAISRKSHALEGPRGDAHAAATFLLDRLV